MLVLSMLWRDIRARLRDRSALIVGIAAPLALMFILSMIAGGPDRSRLQIGYVAAGDSALATAIRNGPLHQLEADGTLRVTEFGSRDELFAAVRAADKVKSGIVIDAGPPAAIEILRGSDAVVSSAVLGAVASRTAAVGDTVAAVIATDVSLGAAPQSPAALSAALNAASPTVTVVDGGESSGGITPKTAIAAGMASFFLFFTVQFGLLGLLEERRTGVLARALAAPVAPWKVLLTKIGVSFLLGLLAMTALVVAARFALSARWGPPLGVAVLILAGVTAAVSTIALVVGLVHNAEQATTVQSIIALVLGLLGGSFFSMARSGGAAQAVAKLTPHYWFQEGLIRISGGRAWTGAVFPAAMMLVFAVVVGAPGLLLARRTVRA